MTSETLKVLGSVLRSDLASHSERPSRQVEEGAAIRILYFAAMLGLPAAAWAEARPPIIKIADTNYLETDRLSQARGAPARVPATITKTAAGVSSSELGAKSNFPYLIVSGFGQADSYVCARIRTIDGYYEARARQPLSAAAKQSGVAELVFPARPQLSQYQTNEIAVLVFTAPNAQCFDRQVYLESHWTDIATQRGGTITLFVSQGSDPGSPEARRGVDDVAAPCVRIEQRRGVSTARSYQFACTVHIKVCRPQEEIAVGWFYAGQHNPGFRQTVRRTCVK